MNAFRPGVESDLALLNWYMRLWADGDIQKLLGPSVWSMSAFMRHFSALDACVLYEADEDGWWIVAWTFPLLGGGTWGLWVRADKRASGSRVGIGFIMESLKIALTQYPVLVNTTKQWDIVEKTKRLGYTYLGCVPELFEGEDCHVLHMTREAFEPLYQRWKAYNERRKN